MILTGIAIYSILQSFGDVSVTKSSQILFPGPTKNEVGAVREVKTHAKIN